MPTFNVPQNQPNGGSPPGSAAFTVVSPTYASTLTTDATQAPGGTLLIVQVGILTGNMTLANPTGAVNRQKIEYIFQQDGTGNRTITLGNQFSIPSSALPLASPFNSTNAPSQFSVANAKTKMLVEYASVNSKFEIVSFIPGY